MELKEILSYPANKDFTGNAKELMNNYCIKKTTNGTIYRYYINEIELYYYGENCPDKSVHPHFFTQAGLFRIHFSGVDITFESTLTKEGEKVKNFYAKRSDKNPTLDYNQIKEDIEDKNVSYGGLLLREIEIEGEKPIKGPWCVLCELFYMEGYDLTLELERLSSSREYSIEKKKRSGLGKNAEENKEDYKKFCIVKKQ